MAVLLLTVLFQFPLPVWHEHGSPTNAAERVALEYHLALFHVGDPGCSEPHLHMILHAFGVEGGCGEDVTSNPGLTISGESCALVQEMTVPSLMPTEAAIDSPGPTDRLAASNRQVTPVHFLQTFAPVGSLPELLSICRC